ncbi:MAG TPA: AarF/UbiB family protein [Thermoanaerobaculia bacterium]|jgi:predicted unusual protein kinase regulating ubiquinone biosynthesis (AarF/ABC1/UbiB family)|nr:AarF/UbiB family protein [Thermoanaerobaculia bacterium]
MTEAHFHRDPADISPRRRFRLLRVYATVARVLLDYGWVLGLGRWRGERRRAELLAACHRRSARRIKATILEVQGLFIKVGQLVSVLSNFLPADFRSDLEALQDRIPARPAAEIESRLRAELGGGPAELFAEFDPAPIASASLAQVHVATYAGDPGGPIRVAVKVQHLDIETTARRDLRALGRILRLVQAILRIRGLVDLAGQVRETIEEELDFTREAASLEQIAANFSADGDGGSRVAIPRVIRARSARRVLTTEFLAGEKISDREALLAAGHDPKLLAERVLGLWCRMVFKEGLYHADPHPGNILVLADGRIGLVDFGAVARLSPAMKAGVGRLLAAVLRRNRPEIVGALEQMGFVRRDPDDDVAGRAIDYLYGRLLAGLDFDSFRLEDVQVDVRMKAEMMADLSKLDISLRDLTAVFQVPREWILLQRTLLLLTGLANELHPDLKPAAIVRPYVEELLLGPDRDWVGLARTFGKEIVASLLGVPGELRSLLGKANRGELKVTVSGFSDGVQLLYAAGQQKLYGLGAFSSAILAFFSLAAGMPPFDRIFAALAALFVLAYAFSRLRARRLLRRLRRAER